MRALGEEKREGIVSSHGVRDIDGEGDAPTREFNANGATATINAVFNLKIKKGRRGRGQMYLSSNVLSLHTVVPETSQQALSQRTTMTQSTKKELSLLGLVFHKVFSTTSLRHFQTLVRELPHLIRM